MTRSRPLAALGVGALIVAGAACGADDEGAADPDEQSTETPSSDAEPVATDIDLDGLFVEDDDFSIDGERGRAGGTGDASHGGAEPVEAADSGGGGGAGSVEADTDATSGSDGSGGGDGSSEDDPDSGESGTTTIDPDPDSDSGEGPIESGSGTGLPGDWPADVPVPEGIDIDNVVDFGRPGAAEIFVSGSVADGFAWFADYGARLVAAGFEEEFSGSTSETASGAYGDDSLGQPTVTVSVTADPSTGGFFVTVGVIGV